MRHVFVCTTGYDCHWAKTIASHRGHGAHRSPDEERALMAAQPEHSNGHIGAHCGEIGGGEIFERFQERLEALGLPEVRLSPNACIAQHVAGPIVMVYPEGTWYGRVSVDDVEEIIQSHVIGGEPVERLVWRTLPAGVEVG